MNYCFDFIETPTIKLFVLDSSEGVHFLIKDNDKRVLKKIERAMSKLLSLPFYFSQILFGLRGSIWI